MNISHDVGLTTKADSWRFIGPSGLSAIKFLREEGFDVTGFEQKPGAGGVWTGSEDARYTAALKNTILGNNKLGVSDLSLCIHCEQKGLTNII